MKPVEPAIIGFKTPDNWRVVRHPDFVLVDEITVGLRERWKESEISGDEWRFSTLIKCSHKGVELASGGFGGRMEWALLGVGSVYLKACDEGVTTEIFELEKIVCAQPGCRNHATVFYRVKALYDNAGNKEELPRQWEKDRLGGDGLAVVHVIRFCQKHRHRGDCGLQDADANYEEIQLPFVEVRP